MFRVAPDKPQMPMQAPAGDMNAPYDEPDMPGHEAGGCEACQVASMILGRVMEQLQQAMQILDQFAQEEAGEPEDEAGAHKASAQMAEETENEQGPEVGS